MVRKSKDIEKNKIFNEMIRRYSEINKEIELTVRNDEYILWLIDFLDKNGWCNNEEGIEFLSFDKIENLEKLNYFKEGIAKYAKKNYIYPEEKNCYKCYYIEYDNFVYRLRWIEKINNEICCFELFDGCLEDINIIKFNDLLEKKELDNVGYISYILGGIDEYLEEYLYGYLVSMKIDNIPSQAVEDEVIKSVKKMVRKINK